MKERGPDVEEEVKRISEYERINTVVTYLKLSRIVISSQLSKVISLLEEEGFKCKSKQKS